MRHLFRIIVVFTLLLLFSSCSKHSTDSESNIKQTGKTSEVTQADIIAALEFGGIGIHKMSLGEFDSTYRIKFITEEFKSSRLVETDTFDYDIVNIDYTDIDTNQVTNEIKYNHVYIKDIRIFSRNLDKRVNFQIAAPGVTLNIDLDFIPTNLKNFYKIVEFENTHWSLNEKVPLLLCGSSWVDENGQNRFCATNKMGENSRSKELLIFSPHYLIISYVTEVINK